LTQTSSGIEPIFKIYYQRRRKVNPGEEGIKISFVDDSGDSWEEYNVIHYPFINWFINSKESEFLPSREFDAINKYLSSLSNKELDDLIEKSPWKNSEAHKIDYIEKIKMLGMITKYLDHSASCTVNLPENTTPNIVSDIYFHAWKSGCKGITIYREGSRAGVLLSKKESDEFDEVNAPKRPKILNSDYYVATANGIRYAVIVGLWKDTNKPYEIFAFENPPLNKNLKGKTIKVEKGHYKFVNGEAEIENLQLAATRVEERAHTIFISMLLRHRASIKHIVHVAKKVDENITSFSSAVRRVLSRYIEEELDGESCPECGSKLRMQEGCVHCINETCGYSRC
jgi:ribonucleoside-diphosphate reductase alpha chain